MRTLAVRGERLQLGWPAGPNDAGNETTHLHLFELDEDGRIDYGGVSTRTTSKAPIANSSAATTPARARRSPKPVRLDEGVNTKGRGDLEKLFGELSAPDLHVENRSRSPFLDRRLRNSARVRGAHRVGRSFRDGTRRSAGYRGRVSSRAGLEAVGLESEPYEWSRILVGRFPQRADAPLCHFEVKDEDAAFAYAEEHMRAAPSRLAVTNAPARVLRPGGWR